MAVLRSAKYMVRKNLKFERRGGFEILNLLAEF